MRAGDGAIFTIFLKLHVFNGAMSVKRWIDARITLYILLDPCIACQNCPTSVARSGTYISIKTRNPSVSDKNKNAKPVTAGHLVAEQLERLGVRTLFTVPGETFLSVLDGLYDRPKISPVLCRHEGGAAMMAEATAKLTGTPGVVFVTRAPGLANAISGMVVARHDQTPLLLLVGLASTTCENRGDLQADEFQTLMGAVAKSVTIVRDPEQIPDALLRAHKCAMTGRPGPVALAFPQDCLNAQTSARAVKPETPVRLPPHAKQIDALAKALNAAKRPMVLVGGGAWSKTCQKNVEQFAKAFDLPVAAAFRCQDFVDNRKPHYVGHTGIAIDAKLKAGIADSDVLITIGANLGDVTTGNYSHVKSPVPDQTLIHIHPESADISKACRASLSIVADVEATTGALKALKPAFKKSPWANWRRRLRKSHKESLEPQPTPGQVTLEHVVKHIDKSLPSSSIITNGAGNYAQFVHRYFRCKGFRSGLAPAAGSMGYGLPAAIAAKLHHPNRTVVAFAGDGCMTMTLQELGTAVQYGLNVIVIVANNGILGTIRMHQERHYPSRVIATTLVNPNFVKLAESFGARGYRVQSNKEFEDAFSRALQDDIPVVIELMLDPDAITPEKTLGAIRMRAP